MNILNTRPIHQAPKLQSIIERQPNARNINLPLIKISPISDKLWLKSCPSKAPDLLIFISANAVHNSIKQLKHLWETPPLIAAIGPATNKALKQYGLSANIVPPQSNSDSLIEQPLLQNLVNKTILLVKGVNGRKTIQNHIKQQEGNLIELNVYQRTLPPMLKHEIKKTWQNYKIDLIIINSIEALTNLISHADTELIDKIKETTWIVLSERIKRHALMTGAKSIITVNDNIAQTISSYIKDRTQT